MSDYSVGVNDNDSFMCSSTDVVLDDMNGLNVCKDCHYRTDFEFINDNFKLRRKTYDLSSTYDGYYIASLKFKEFILREKIKDIDFIVLKKEPEFFVMFVRCTIAFDTDKRESQSENFCNKCGYYESYVGATPAFLKEPLNNELCRTDIMFGSGNGKSPLLIASEQFVTLIKREKFKGFYFQETRT